jgi:uncharacterized protein (DUF1810 family)
LVLAVRDKSAHDVCGSPDDIKFRSSMTLFDVVDGGNLYRRAIDRFFDRKPDRATRERLSKNGDLIYLNGGS